MHRSAHVSIALHVAARDAEGPGEVGVLCDRLVDGENRRQRLVLGDDAGGAALRVVECLGQHPRDGLVVEHDLARKQRLVAPGRAGVSLTRHVGARQHRHHARHLQRGCGVERQQPRMRVRRKHGPRVEQARIARQQVVGVERTRP